MASIIDKIKSFFTKDTSSGSSSSSSSAATSKPAASSSSGSKAGSSTSGGTPKVGSAQPGTVKTTSGTTAPKSTSGQSGGGQTKQQSTQKAAPAPAPQPRKKSLSEILADVQAITANANQQIFEADQRVQQAGQDMRSQAWKGYNDANRKIFDANQQVKQAEQDIRTQAWEGYNAANRQIFDANEQVQQAGRQNIQNWYNKAIQPWQQPPKQELYAEATQTPGVNPARGTVPRGGGSVYDYADNRDSSLYDGQYADILNRPDFAQLSQAGDRKTKWWQPYSGDGVYDYINDINGTRDRINGEMEVNRAYQDYGKYAFMTEDEIGVYNYLYATEGRRAADSYLKNLEPELDRQWYSGASRITTDWVNQNLLTQALGSGATVLARPARQVANALAKKDDIVRLAQGREVNPYSSYRQMERMTGDLRGSVAEDIARRYSEEAGAAYLEKMDDADAWADQMVRTAIASGLGMEGSGEWGQLSKRLLTEGKRYLSRLLSGYTLTAEDKRLAETAVSELSNDPLLLAAADDLPGDDKDIATWAMQEALTLIVDGITHYPVQVNWEMFRDSVKQRAKEELWNYYRDKVGPLIRQKHEDDEIYLGMLDYFENFYWKDLRKDNQLGYQPEDGLDAGNAAETVAPTGNSDIIPPRTIGGALNPDSERAEKHAIQYYESVRKMTSDAQRIAENTGYPEDLIRAIKEFIFVEEHDLGYGRNTRFDPSYEMAESWQRLIDGKNIQPHDLTLLQHELMERDLMQKGYSQVEAHIAASKRYNYKEEAREYYGQVGKHKKK